MKSANDPRHQSRIIALQKLFEYEFKSNSPFEIRDLKNINLDKRIDEKFSLALMQGVVKNKEELDKMIQKYAPKRPLKDISKIDLLILRIALYEMLFSNTPKKVVIDESVELAKEFGGERSFTFVNGVLANIETNGN